MDNKNEPFQLFSDWYSEALKRQAKEPAAVALATADSEGKPSVRMVLLKAHGPEGFVFYTNLESTKGNHLKSNPWAAMCFHWDNLEKQIRIEGKVVPVSDAEADAYFATRARDSQIGAWASEQSRKLQATGDLAKRVASFTMKYGIGTVPRPAHWSGFRIIPERIEFWHNRKFRLHDRFCFERSGDGTWIRSELYP